MAYDLYIDVLFLMNFLMDTLLLWTLRKILKYRGSPLRLFLSLIHISEPTRRS